MHAHVLCKEAILREGLVTEIACVRPSPQYVCACVVQGCHFVWSPCHIIHMRMTYLQYVCTCGYWGYPSLWMIDYKNHMEKQFPPIQWRSRVKDEHIIYFQLECIRVINNIVTCNSFFHKPSDNGVDNMSNGLDNRRSGVSDKRHSVFLPLVFTTTNINTYEPSPRDGDCCTCIAMSHLKQECVCII